MSTNLEARVSAFYDLKPREFSFLRSISLRQELDLVADEVHQHLTIVLARDARCEGPLLHIELIDVENCKIEQPAMTHIELSPIEIHPAPPHFGKPILVFHGEQERVFVCSCRDFTARVSPAEG